MKIDTTLKKVCKLTQANLSQKMQIFELGSIFVYQSLLRGSFFAPISKHKHVIRLDYSIYSDTTIHFG